jgi:hypothetical protein
MPRSKPFNAVVTPLGRLWLKGYARWFAPEPACQTAFDMSDMFGNECLQFVSPTQAHFTAAPKHHSALGVGPVHGGCQPILMELVGRHVAMHAIPTTTTMAMASTSATTTTTAYLDAIQLSHHSAASVHMKLEAEVLSIISKSSSNSKQRHQNPYSVSMRILLVRWQDNALVSEGILTFVTTSPTRVPTTTNTNTTPLVGGGMNNHNNNHHHHHRKREINNQRHYSMTNSHSTNSNSHNSMKSITHRTDSQTTTTPPPRSLCYRNRTIIPTD